MFKMWCRLPALEHKPNQDQTATKAIINSMEEEELDDQRVDITGHSCSWTHTQNATAVELNY